MMFRVVPRPMFTAFKYLLINCIFVHCLLLNIRNARISLNVKRKKIATVHYERYQDRIN